MEKLNLQIYLFVVIVTLIFSGTGIALEENPNQLLRDAPTQFYYPEKDAVVWKEEQVFDYSTQPGTISHYNAIKIFNQQGAKKHSQIKINYHPQQHQLEITKALVIKPSGEVVNIEQDQIKERPIKYTPDSRVYQGQYQKVIDVPEIEKGSILIYAYQKKIKKRLIPEEIQFTTKVDSHQSKVVVKIPRDRDIKTKVEPKNELNEAVVNKTEEIKKYTWSGYKAQAEILISTLDSWRQISSWYHDLITNQSELNQNLREEIAALTKDANTKRKKIKQLYNYVADNINYLDYKLGVNGYQPLLATEIYENKYAVAKDKAYFLSVLLEEIDVENELVLINTKKEFEPGVVTMDFSHILLYLPEQDLYLAPNSGFIRYGNLALDEQGKKVLSLDKGQIRETPILSKNKNQEETTVKIVLKENGTADINLIVKTQGFYDYIAKTLLKALSSAGQRDTVTNIVNKHFEKPKFNKIDIKGVKDLTESSDLNLDFSVQNYYQVKEGQAVIEPNKLPISFLLSIAETRNTLPCKIKRQVVLEIPTQYNEVILPEDQSFSNHEGKLNISYQKKEEQVIINFDYQFNRLVGVEKVSWVYINDLLEQYQELKEQKILLVNNKKNDIQAGN
ncbi:MAG: DUF3857 domain-containing protein [Bacillota bacterium]